MTELLKVEDLSVSFASDERDVAAVRNVSFHIDEGEIVGLVGESGSGKTVTGMSILRLIPRPPGRIDSGRILFRDEDLLQMPISDLRRIRGRDISVIFQEPMTALSPLHTVGRQLRESVLLHRDDMTRREAWELGVEWLDKVGIPDARARMSDYPYQFSGGMRQRVMIAMSLMLEPRLIIADEPTTALDVTIQAQIFDLILAMKGRNTSILFITHDMGVIWELCDRVMVMKDAHIVEEGSVDAIFHRPREAYTQDLLAAVPRLSDPPRRASPAIEIPASESSPDEASPLIDVGNVRTWFPIKRGVFARTVGHVKAVDGVSLSIRPRETFSLVGESGSGKTTLGRTILGLDKAREGTIHYAGRPLHDLPHRELRRLRKNLQMIFQDPFSSLNPRLTVLGILTEGLAAHGLLDGHRRDVAARWLEEVGLEADHMHRYPHEFSGGQRQRICIARAIAMQPEFIVCDEAVSALDVTIQAQVLDLLMELQGKYGVAYLFISHDLSVVKRISDRVAVMKDGRIIEHGRPEEVIGNPRDDYTKRLVDAVPNPGGPRRRGSV